MDVPKTLGYFQILVRTAQKFVWVDSYLDFIPAIADF
jgi:hypothetical protein